ncbi:hypothetical protein GCM10023093_28710 [Nemorincola caseinilytica]|uniref:Uncharacterized protein n=1 Tax=Nemorincola caseinilytica TaxID=2054315 RepID=A0ABP8NLM7_9BACT
MKTILLLTTLSLFAFAASAQQEVWDASHNVKGYINKDGTVHDPLHNLRCTFQQGGRILDVHGSTIGYIVNEYELQDASHTIKGYIHQNGIVENAAHTQIGRINIDGSGPVKDGAGNVIGYLDSTEPMWAAAYFFLLHY